MNTIKVYLAESGRIADLKKDFPLYQGQYQNKLLNVFVPTSILAPNFSVQQAGQTIADYVSSTAVKIGMRTIERNGKINISKTYYMRYLKTLICQNVEYALYERKLPREFTFYAGQGSNAPQLIANVVNINNETTPATILEIIPSQTCSLDVMPSDYLDKDEPIEATSLEEINGRLNAIDENLALKQNITDESLETTAKTIVGAINENTRNIATNTQDILKNEQDIATNRNSIDQIIEAMTIGEEYVGTLRVSTLPNDTTLNNFVQQQKGRTAKSGDSIIVILEIGGETDKNYKYIYNGTTWSSYEIPPIEEAHNGSLGIIEGTFGLGLNYSVLVDISGGQIKDIYIKKDNGNYENLQVYINMNAQDISDIINGDTIVGEAVKAMQDGLGNNIANTYLTQVLGATKQYVRDYAMPREFSNIYFISNGGYVLQVPETPPSGIQFSTTTNAVGNFTLFQLDKINNAQFELSSINGYSNILYVSASANCSVAFRLTTQYKKQGQDWQNLNVELTNQISLTSGDIQKISLSSPFISLGDNVLMLDIGDIIRQKLEIVTQTSENITFDLYSNDIYPSTFTLTSQSYTLADIDQVKGQTIFMGVDGIIEANRVVFEVQNANAYIEYRTNQREFLITALLPLVGAVDSSLPVAITFGDKTYNVYSFLKGTDSPLTIGDLMAVSRYNSEVGYLFYSKMIFVETSDIVGFVLSPSNITASQLAEIIDTNGNIVVSLDVSGTKLSFHLSSDTVSKLSRALLTPLSAPPETKLVAVDNTNSQEMLGLGDRFVVNSGEINLSELTEKAIDFAEMERQKSKNLFNVYGKFDAGRPSGTSNYSVDTDGVLTTTNNYSASHIKGKSVSVVPNKTYCMQAKLISSSVTVKFYIMYMDSDTTSVIIKNDAMSTTDITIQAFTVPNNATSVYVSFATYDGSPATIKDIQVEEGSVATSYQPYNGAIVHEKDIAGVEKIELIYDKTTKNIINGVAYTNGLGNGSHNIDFSKYKKIICYLFRPMSNLIVDLQQLDIDDNLVYRCRNCSDARYVSNESTIYMYSANITVSSTKGVLTLDYKWSNGNGAGGDIGGIYKIEGVY